jgi:hypothetical protein
MLVPLLGYFFCMIAVLTAAVGLMIGVFNTSKSERVRQYPRPVVERNFAAANTQPRLFMVVPETKDGSLAKNTEANSTSVPAEKADAKANKPRNPKALAGQRQNYEGHGYAMTLGYSEGRRALELNNNQ